MWIFIMLGLLAGLASTVQASINNSARGFFRSPFITALVNFTVAWLLLAAFLIASEGGIRIPLAAVAENPPWIWLGGVCAIIIVSLNIICLPKLGAAGNVIILNVGQILTGLVIDHFALFGAEAAPMTMLRTAGAVLVTAGMILVTRDPGASREGSRGVPMLYAVLAFICGVACSVQIAVNGTLRSVVQSISKATIISMSVAFISTTLLIVVLLMVKGRKGIFDSQDAPAVRLRPWMLTGGIFALTVVSSNAAAAPVIGTGLSTVMNLIGMMASGLVIDATGFLGIEKKPVTLIKAAGMLIMLAGTVMISV